MTQTSHKGNDTGIGENPLGRDEDLPRKVVTGAFWVYLLQQSVRLLDVIRIGVLARFLLPEDLGVVGIAMLLSGILDVFSQAGFQSALIQRKDLQREHLDTVWTVAVFRGVILCAIMLAAAPFIGNFYDAQRSIPVIRVVGLSFLFRGFANVGVIHLSRELRFGKTFFYEISVSLSGFIATVLLAAVLRNEWALVLGLLCQSVVRLVGSYVVDPFRPGLRFHRREAALLYSYGVWIFFTAVLTFLARQGDRLILPKMLDVRVFGLYIMAFNVAVLPATQVGVVSRVLFPAYSRLLHDFERLKNYYRRALTLIPFITIPACGGIFALAPGIAHILGEKWLPIIPVVRILVLSTMIKTVTDSSSALFNALGKPWLTLILTGVRVVILALAVYPLTVLWGMEGTAAAMFLSAMAGILVWVFGVRRTIGFSIWDLMKPLMWPVISTALMMAFVVGAGRLTGQTGLKEVLILIALGCGIYAICILFAHRVFGYPIVASIKQIWYLFRKRRMRET